MNALTDPSKNNWIFSLQKSMFPNILPPERENIKDFGFSNYGRFEYGRTWREQAPEEEWKDLVIPKNNRLGRVLSISWGFWNAVCINNYFRFPASPPLNESIHCSHTVSNPPPCTRWRNVDFFSQFICHQTMRTMWATKIWHYATRNSCLFNWLLWMPGTFEVYVDLRMYSTERVSSKIDFVHKAGI